MSRLYLRIGLILLLAVGSFAMVMGAQATTLPRVLGVEIEPSTSFEQSLNYDIAPEDDIFELRDHAYRITKEAGWKFLGITDTLLTYKESDDSTSGIYLTVIPTANMTAADVRTFYAGKNYFFQEGSFGALKSFTDGGTVVFNGYSARKMIIEDMTGFVDIYLFPYGDRTIFLLTSNDAANESKADIDLMLQSLIIGTTPTIIPPTSFKQIDQDISLSPSNTWVLGTTTESSFSGSFIDISHKTRTNVFASFDTSYIASFNQTREEVLETLNFNSKIFYPYTPSSTYELVLLNSDHNLKLTETIQPISRSEYVLRHKDTNKIEARIILYDIFTAAMSVRLGLYIYDPTDAVVNQATADFQTGILDKLQINEPMWQPTVDEPPIVVPVPTPLPEPIPPVQTTNPDATQLKSDDHVRGNLNAPIVLVEYTDLECPFCKTFHPILKAIKEGYGDQVAWVYRPFPLSFHANAQKEAEAAECVASIGGNEKFWNYIDAIFDRTSSNGSGFALDKLAPLAQEVGVDLTQFNACLDSGQSANKVADSLVEGQVAGVNGTPMTFLMVKGKVFNLLPGALPRMTIEEAIKQAFASIGITSTYDTTAAKKITVMNNQLRANVSGRIVLKVEDRGRAYYINPKTNIGHFLGRAEDAYQVMRQEGIGITNADLKKIPLGLISLSGADTDGDGLTDALEDAIGTNKNSMDSDGDGYLDREELLNGYSPTGPERQTFDTNFSNKNKGLIFLQVEHRGEAWYINPVDGKRYFLGTAANAYQIMRNLGLGISNVDFNRLSSAN